mgnify:CR=1 FL=1
MTDGTSGDGGQGSAGSLSSMDFSTFVISLGSNALMHLGIQGEGQQPVTSDAPSEAQLELAQQTIDILAMLEEKTAGNLQDSEEQLLSSVLYQVRMAFLNRGK